MHLLREFASAASTDRNRVELHVDRSYKLLEARKLGSAKKRERDPSSISEGNPIKSTRLATNSISEVFDLL